jgi:hypothetical protein
MENSEKNLMNSEYPYIKNKIKKLCYCSIGSLLLLSGLTGTIITQSRNKEQKSIEQAINIKGGYPLEIKVGRFADILDTQRFRYSGLDNENKIFIIQEEKGIDLIQKSYPINTKELRVGNARYKIINASKEALTLAYMGESK